MISIKGISVNEESLIANYERGQEKELYQHFFSYAMSIALRYSSAYEDAIEIVNDSFMKVFKSIHKYEDSNFKAWLRRIVINTATDLYRREKKYAFIERIDEETFDITEDELTSAQLAYDELLFLVQELPPAYRTVFNLYAIDGYKHHEIAEMLKITTGTSKSNLARARGILKKSIKKNTTTEFEETSYLENERLCAVC